MPRIAWILLSVASLAIFVLAIALIVIPAPNERSVFVSENVHVSRPPIDGSVTKKFTVIGEARGPWFFEASFPVQVRDPDNNLVGQGIAQAEGEWMTTEFVPFTAPVSVADYSGPAMLVLIKDNPSGLPEHDDSVSIPITVLP